MEGEAMTLTIDVAGDDFLNRDFLDIHGCPMCVATRRVVVQDATVTMAGDYARINGVAYPFVEINGKLRVMGDSSAAVRRQRPFTFTIEIPEALVKPEYREPRVKLSQQVGD